MVIAILGCKTKFKSTYSMKILSSKDLRLREIQKIKYPAVYLVVWLGIADLGLTAGYFITCKCLSDREEGSKQH